jgi:predicted transcriptional regulator
MFNLIELTGQEIAVGNVTVTLYAIAKKFGKNHSKALTAFAKDIEKLRPEQLVGCQIVQQQIEVSRGDKGGKQSIATYEVDIKTAVWFYTRYDAELRRDIVDYAFDKLKEEHDEKVTLLETKLSVKPKIECTNTNLNSRTARHEELMRLVEEDCLTHEKKVITKHIYEVTEKGKKLGFYKQNNIIMFNVKGE